MTRSAPAARRTRATCGHAPPRARGDQHVGPGVTPHFLATIFGDRLPAAHCPRDYCSCAHVDDPNWRIDRAWPGQAGESTCRRPAASTSWCEPFRSADDHERARDVRPHRQEVQERASADVPTCARHRRGGHTPMNWRGCAGRMVPWTPRPLGAATSTVFTSVIRTFRLGSA